MVPVATRDINVQSRTLTGTCEFLSAPCSRYTVQPDEQPLKLSVKGLPSWGLIEALLVMTGLATTPVAKATVVAAATENFIFKK